MTDFEKTYQNYNPRAAAPVSYTHLDVYKRQLLGEGHDVNALLTQSRANRGSRSRLAGLDLQLNVASNFLCHNKCLSLIHI